MTTSHPVTADRPRRALAPPLWPWHLALPLLASLLVSACSSESTPCGEKYCGPGFTCDPKHDLCVLTSQLADCVGIPDGVACTVLGEPGYVCHQEVCIPSSCGDGVLDPNQDEECDEGLDNSDTVPNACREDCQDPSCGDNVIDSGEVCDDGDANSDLLSGACRTNCTYSDCGNGRLDAAEECDDGPNNSDTLPNACRQSCHLPGCGDGAVDAGEACDDGNVDDHDGCRNNCELPFCGDAVHQVSVEQCDATDLAFQTCATRGFASGSLHCTRDCAFDLSQCRDGCGNGIIEAGEVCDGSNLADATCEGLGFTSGTLGCNASCTAVVTSGNCYDGCKNDILEGAEECDGLDTANWLYADCPAAGFGGGTLICDVDACRLDYSQCHGGCGNEIVDAGEECDGAALGPETCADFGLDPGALVCGPDCTYVLAGCPGCGNGAVDPGEECDDDNVTDWDGCNTCVIGESRVNAAHPGDQDYPAVAMAADGVFVVVWQSADQDASGTLGIYGRRFDALARPLGPEFQVNTHVAGDQGRPQVAMASDGRFVVVWQSAGQDSGSTWGVYLQRYDAAGAPVGQETVVNTTLTGDQTLPTIGMAADGTFAVAWQSTQGGDDDIYARRFDALGAPLGAEVRVNAYDADDQREPALRMADNHSFVVVWESYGQEPQLYDTWGVFGRGFNAQGAAVSSDDFRINTFIPLVYDHEWDAALAMTYTGLFVVAWDAIGNNSRKVEARKYNSPGNAVAGELDIDGISPSDHPPNPAVAVADNFGYVVVWDEGGGILAELHDTSASAAAFQVNRYAGTGEADHADVAMAWNGPFIVVWSMPDGPNGREIFAQRFDALGNRRAVGVAGPSASDP